MAGDLRTHHGNMVLTSDDESKVVVVVALRPADLRTMCPVTRVFPKLRVANMEGALISYQSFFLKGS